MKARELRSSRGAGLVEYALGIAAFALVALIGLQALEDRSGEALDERAALLEAPEQYGFIGVASQAPPPSIPPDDPDDGSEQEPVLVEGYDFEWSSTPGPGNNRWSATITFSILGSGATGVYFSGDWVIGGGGSSSQTQCMTTGGTCSMVATNVHNNQGTVTFTLTEIGGEDVELGDGVILPLTIEIPKP